MSKQVNGTSCPRCRRSALVRAEHVMRGNDAYVNYQCGACRYSWQVRDEARPKRPATGLTRSSGQPHNDGQDNPQ
jgi:transposase-like protein